MNAHLSIILSAFLHATWNALIKRWGNAQVTTTGLIIMATAFAYLSLFFVTETFFASTNSFLWGVGAGLAEGGYFITLALGLRSGKLGPFYSISRGGAMIVVWIISLLTNLTHFSPVSTIGGVLILLGIFLSSPQSSLDGQKSKSELLAPYLCAVFIGIHHICYKFSLNSGSNPPALFCLSLTIGIPILLYVQSKETKTILFSTFKQNVLKYALGGIVCFSSFVIFLIGFKSQEPNVAISLRNTSILFALFFSRILGEKLNLWQIVGGIFVALGATLVTR